MLHHKGATTTQYMAMHTSPILDAPTHSCSTVYLPRQPPRPHRQYQQYQQAPSHNAPPVATPKYTRTQAHLAPHCSQQSLNQPAPTLAEPKCTCAALCGQPRTALPCYQPTFDHTWRHTALGLAPSLARPQAACARYLPCHRCIWGSQRPINATTRAHDTRGGTACCRPLPCCCCCCRCCIPPAAAAVDTLPGDVAAAGDDISDDGTGPRLSLVRAHIVLDKLRCSNRCCMVSRRCSSAGTRSGWGLHTRNRGGSNVVPGKVWLKACRVV